MVLFPDLAGVEQRSGNEIGTMLFFLLPDPNSWFGLNKQDYWAWIEPLQDYYFNEK